MAELPYPIRERLEKGRRTILEARRSRKSYWIRRAPQAVEASRTGIFTKLFNAHEGERNKLLFWAARCLGEMIRDGELELETSRTALEDAGANLYLDPGEIAPTVESGLARGMVS